ncbi:Hypothetical protein PHPALM_11397 [Phytophthora palmivora]|uniref:Uncharacterized protein n=1 Tax=Phytophthora palmivora TaxID=4796 RepID=A0A2P4Y2B9_9STRA|nr:Hypothetical protein PHPALM_11397 [Phytophthora palmivora]
MPGHLRYFYGNNPSLDRIRAILIDRDIAEISLLTKESPLARILICHYHLKKCVLLGMIKAVYGGREVVDVIKSKMPLI